MVFALITGVLIAKEFQVEEYETNNLLLFFVGVLAWPITFGFYLAFCISVFCIYLEENKVIDKLLLKFFNFFEFISSKVFK